MLEIDQVPIDTQYYDPDSFKKTIDNIEEVFMLPSYCQKGNKCSLLSTCRAVGFKWLDAIKFDSQHSSI